MFKWAAIKGAPSCNSQFSDRVSKRNIREKIFLYPLTIWPHVDFFLIVTWAYEIYTDIPCLKISLLSYLLALHSWGFTDKGLYSTQCLKKLDLNLNEWGRLEKLNPVYSSSSSLFPHTLSSVFNHDFFSSRGGSLLVKVHDQQITTLSFWFQLWYTGFLALGKSLLCWFWLG